MIACPPITTWVAPAANTYEVRVESGSVTCADARTALRRYIVTAAAPSAWTCFRGHSGDAWAAACARDSVLTRAYGPTREHDSWRIAAARFHMTVFRPTRVPIGLRLASFKTSRVNLCGSRVERLAARYKTATGYVHVFEWNGCDAGPETRDCSSIGEGFGGDFHVQVSGCAPQAVLEAIARALRPVLV